MFFKRLSRSSRSNSYAEDNNSNHYVDSPRSLTNADAHFSDDRDIHDSPRGGTPQHNSYNAPGSPTKDTQRPDSSRDSNKMYPTTRSSQAPADPYARAGVVNGNRNSLHLDAAALNGGALSGVKQESAPDLLTRAFNEAVRPYTDKIEALEQQLADMQGYVEALERERVEMHGWIDKRGLRPGTSTRPPDQLINHKKN
jgi:hypothetical protein